MPIRLVPRSRSSSGQFHGTIEKQTIADQGMFKTKAIFMRFDCQAFCHGCAKSLDLAVLCQVKVVVLKRKYY